ncbi:hypothetical protein [Cohnella algarum]|uniref:hypothetical protein n=1 Tax=Cohnella algarum TaxID=2044859 RepID=UPI0019673F35|nr:hypothetical protein [Cohnella algarum]MBN2981776.1 hypothetical protein [Cohnella algarum]
MTGLRRKDLLVTFSAAFAFIVYEVFLSRFFSAVMEYHYVFLAVSLATLGIGLGGSVHTDTLHGSIDAGSSAWGYLHSP